MNTMSYFYSPTTGRYPVDYSSDCRKEKAVELVLEQAKLFAAGGGGD